LIARPDPDALMAGELGEWLRAQEAGRAEARAKAAWRQKLGIGAACAVAFLYILLKPSDIVGALQFGFFVGVAGFGWAALARKPMVDKIKGGINGAIARALGLSYANVVADRRIFEAAKQFEMLPGYDNETLEDQWAGTLGGLPFMVHEAKLTERRGSGKNRRTVTVFAGCLMSVAFNRPFGGTTLVERSGRHRSWFGGEKEEISLGGLTLRRIAMVDPRFAEDFAVWSDDGVEARYLVHPEYVERLMAVEAAYEGKNIRALFSQGALIIVIESGNLFESGSLEASQDRRQLEKSIDQFWSLAELAEKLNERPRASFN
jgi:hypothetical protein